MSQEEGVQRRPSIGGGRQVALSCPVPGMQAPGAAEAGVDVQAGTMERMHAGPQRLE